MKIRSWMGTRALAIALGAFTVVGATTTDAAACGGAWFDYEMLIDFRDQGVDRAERSLEEGDEVAAAGAVIRMIPHIRQLKASSSPVIQRAMRILAVAAARHDGRLPIEKEVPSWVAGQKEWLGADADDRTANLDWAIASLRQVEDIKKDDPVAKTELAEALARVDEHRGEARDILEKLAKKDLIVSAEGYAALAELRADDGDSQGSKLAMERCRKMVGENGVCGATAKS